jgi:hypothetical protein
MLVFRIYWNIIGNLQGTQAAAMTVGELPAQSLTLLDRISIAPSELLISPFLVGGFSRLRDNFSLPI